MTDTDTHVSFDGFDEHRDEEIAAPRARPNTGVPAFENTSFTSFVSDTPANRRRSMPSARELGLVRPEKRVHQNGWQKALHRTTGGTVDTPAAASEYVENLGIPARPTHGICSIAVLSLKGGVGKTTTTVGLGSTIAAIRGDRVIAVDANPDFGTLAQRGPDTSRSTVRDLLSDTNVVRYSDIRRHTSQSTNRLEFLGSERDPAVSESFSEGDYNRVHRVLDRFYNVILADCGTGLTHSAIQGVLNNATALVIVASPAIDCARSALATLDWLAHHGYSHLVPNATVVVSSAWAGESPVDVNKLASYFKQHVRAVVVVPYDDHLAEGGEINLERVGRRTRQAYADLASAMPVAFGQPSRFR